MANTIAKNAETTVQINWVGVRGNREPLDSSSVMTTYTELLTELDDTNTGTIYAGEYTAVEDTSDKSNNGPYYVTYSNNNTKYVAHKISLQENVDETYTYLVHSIVDDERVTSKAVNYIYDGITTNEEVISRAINYLNYKIDEVYSVAHMGKLADHFNLSIHDVLNFIVQGKVNYYYHLGNDTDFNDEDGNLITTYLNSNADTAFLFKTEVDRPEDYRFEIPSITADESTWKNNYNINIGAVTEPYTYVHYTNTFTPTISVAVNDAGFIDNIKYSALSYDSTNRLLENKGVYTDKTEDYDNTIISNAESRAYKQYSLPEFTLSDIIWYGDPGTKPVSIISRIYDNTRAEGDQYYTNKVQVSNGQNTITGINIESLTYGNVPTIRYRNEVLDSEIYIVNTKYDNTYSCTYTSLAYGSWETPGTETITSSQILNTHTIYNISTAMSPTFKCYYKLTTTDYNISDINSSNIKTSLDKSFSLNWSSSTTTSPYIYHTGSANEKLIIAIPTTIYAEDGNVYNYDFVSRDDASILFSNLSDTDKENHKYSFITRYNSLSKANERYEGGSDALNLNFVEDISTNIGQIILKDQTTSTPSDNTNNKIVYKIYKITIDADLPTADYLTFTLKRTQA